MTALTQLQRDFLNRYQGDFPLTDRPFMQIAETLGTDEAALISLVHGLLADGTLTRFGPLFDAERLGGRFTLAALAVPEGAFDRVADAVNALPEVAHNYRRNHSLNMWFVLAAADEPGLKRAMERIRSLTGLPLYDFPKLKEFHLGFWLTLDDEGRVDLRRIERQHLDAPRRMDSLDQVIVAATQAGLPLTPEPYAAVAAEAGCDARTVLERMGIMLRNGAIRRIGAVPNHYRLGLRGNGMSVWDVPDELAGDLGERVGALDFVSHCYIRPRHLPLWPYNLFAMVHGRDRAEVASKVEIIADLIGSDCRRHQVLYSEAVLKKTGLRLAA